MAFKPNDTSTSYLSSLIFFINFHSCVMFAMKFMKTYNDLMSYVEIII